MTGSQELERGKKSTANVSLPDVGAVKQLQLKLVDTGSGLHSQLHVDKVLGGEGRGEERKGKGQGGGRAACTHSSTLTRWGRKRGEGEEERTGRGGGSGKGGCREWTVEQVEGRDWGS